MHTRRFGAFIVGMWLMGNLLMWFVKSQSTLNVEGIIGNPPQQVQKEISDMGPDVARQMFRYQAFQLNRRIDEVWEILQLGLGGALLATSVLTVHRSRIVVTSTLLMMIMTAIQAFSLTPVMTGLSRSYDFLPATAALMERENFRRFESYHLALDVLKTGLALTVVARLMFDFYDFGTFVNPWGRSKKGSPVKVRRRRRRVPGAASGVSSAQLAAATGAQSEDLSGTEAVEGLAEAQTPPSGERHREAE